MPTVDIEGTNISIDFPDSMSKEQIVAAMKKNPKIHKMRMEHIAAEDAKKYKAHPDTKPSFVLKDPTSRMKPGSKVPKSAPKSDGWTDIETGKPLHFTDNQMLAEAKKQRKQRISDSLGPAPPPKPLPKKEPLATYQRRRAEELGVTPEASKRLGVAPAVAQAKSMSGEKGDYNRYSLPAGSRPSAKAQQLARSVHDDKGSLLNQVFPGFDLALKEPGKGFFTSNPILHQEQRAAAGLLNSAPILAGFAIAPEVGIPEELVTMAGRGMVAQGVNSAIHNTELFKENPADYWGDLITNTAMLGLPEAQRIGMRDAPFREVAKGIDKPNLPNKDRAAREALRPPKADVSNKIPQVEKTVEKPKMLETEKPNANATEAKTRGEESKSLKGPLDEHGRSSRTQTDAEKSRPTEAEAHAPVKAQMTEAEKTSQEMKEKTARAAEHRERYEAGGMKLLKQDSHGNQLYYNPKDGTYRVRDVSNVDPKIYDEKTGEAAFKNLSKGNTVYTVKPKTEEVKPNAVQEQKPAESVLREERSEVELRGVGEGNKEETSAGKGQEKEKAVETRTTPQTPSPGTTEANTGLANRIQAEEVAAGKIAEPVKGKTMSAQEAVEHGKAVLDAHPEPLVYASKLAKDVAKGDMPYTPENVGIMQSANSRFYERVNKAQSLADEAIKSGKGIEEAQAHLKTAEDEHKAFLDDVAESKTTWHNIGMAWQAEVDLEQHSYAGLIGKARRIKGAELTPEERQARGNEADIIKAHKERADKLETELNKLREERTTDTANDIVKTRTETVRRRTRRDVKDIHADREAIRQQFKIALSKSAGKAFANPVEVLVDVAPHVKALLDNYIEEYIDKGIDNIHQFTDWFRKEVSDQFSEGELHQMISGQGLPKEPVKSSDKTKLKARLTEEAKYLEMLDDERAGNDTSRKAQPAKPKSPVAQAAADEIKAIREDRRVDTAIAKIKEELAAGVKEPSIRKAAERTEKQKELAELQKQKAAAVRELRSIREAREKSQALNEQEARLKGPEGQKEYEKIQNERAERQAERERKLAEKSAEYRAAQNDLRYAREKVEAQLRDMAPKTRGQRWLDTSKNYTRMAKIATDTVYGKLSSATVSHIFLGEIEDIMGTVAGQLKVGGVKLKDIAGREGTYDPAGFKKKIEGMSPYKLTREGIQRNERTLAALKSEWLEGTSATKRRAGISGHDVGPFHWDTPLDKANSVIKVVGRTHSVEKTFLREGEFKKSEYLRAKRATERGLDINDPMVSERIEIAAAMDAINATMENENAAAKLLSDHLIKGPQKSPNAAARFAGHIMETVIPILRLPANFVSKTAQLTGLPGIAEGVRLHTKAIRETKQGIKLSPEDADTIVRAYKAGGIGAITATLGLGGIPGVQFSGYYTGDDRNAHAGEVTVGGYVLPKYLAHSPLLEACQFWATVKNEYVAQVKHENTRNAKTKQYPEPTNVPHKLSHAGFDAITGLAREAPGVESLSDLLGLLSGAQGANSGMRTAGSITAADLIPGFSKNIADKVNPGDVESKGFLDEYWKRIPIVKGTMKPKPKKKTAAP